MASSLAPPVVTGSRTLGWRRPQLSLGVCGVAGAIVVGAAAGLGPLAGGAALLGCLVAAAVLLRPASALIVLGGVVPAASGLQRGLPVPGLRLSEIALGGVAALVLLRLDGSTSPPWRAFDWAALAYVVGTVVLGAADVFSRGEGLDATSLGTLLGPFQFLLLYRATLSVLVNEDRRGGLLRLMLLPGAAVAILTLLQRFGALGVPGLLTRLTGFDARVAEAADVDSFGGLATTLRATGPFPHWQVLAGYLFVVGLLALALLLEPRQRAMRPGALVVVLVLSVAGIVASGTFTTTLGLAAGGLVLGLWARRFGHVVLGLGVAVVTTGVLFGGAISVRVAQQFSGIYANGLLPQSVAYRVSLWQNQILPLLDGRWLTGYGPSLPPGLSFPYTESVYLTLLMRGGVILLGTYALLMAALAVMAHRDLHHADPLQRVVARVLLILVVLLIPFHLLEPYFVVTGLPHLLWILAAIASAGALAQRVPPSRPA